MRFEVVIFGDKVVATQFTRMGQRAANAAPALRNVGEYLMQVTDTQFSSQGRRGGGSWAKLSPQWLFRKQRLGHDPRILHMSGALRRSVTKWNARGSTHQVSNTQLIFGTNLPYAGRHQFGYETTPKRQFLKVTDRDRVHMRNLIRDHLMEAWRGGRLA